MRFLTRAQVFSRLTNNGHALFDDDSRNYNLNIIGIRSKNAKVANFGCQLMVAWKRNGQWHDRSFTITTFPVRYCLSQKILNPCGTFILAPGQFLEAFEVGVHDYEYESLCQTNDVCVKVYRDKDIHCKFDLCEENTITGCFGINFHYSRDRETTTRLGLYSAGHQVFANDDEFYEFMSLILKARKSFPNRFTYTLVEE